MVVRIEAGGKVGDGLGQVRLGDDVVVFAVFIPVGDVEARSAEGKGFCDL